jgi:hypothetical protein
MSAHAGVRCMRKLRNRAKARPSPLTPSELEDPGVLETLRRATLETQYRERCAAFSGWETARARNDLALYRAIARLVEFATAVGNDRDPWWIAVQRGQRTGKRLAH